MESTRVVLLSWAVLNEKITCVSLEISAIPSTLYREINFSLCHQ
jgi:hypothetical protein